MSQARPQFSSLVGNANGNGNANAYANALVEKQKKIERRNKAIEQLYNRDGPVHYGHYLCSNLRVNNQASFHI